MEKLIYKEDFGKFNADELPYNHEHSAIGEYQYCMPEGFIGDFYDPIPLHQWRSQGGSWNIIIENGVHYLEQNRGDYTKDHFVTTYSTLVLNKQIYADYHVQFNIRFISTSKPSGICFNYIDNRLFDAVFFENGFVKFIHRNKDEFKTYIFKEFKVNDLETYKIDLYVGKRTILYIDDKKILDADISVVPSKMAFISKACVRYSSLNIYMSEDNIEKNSLLEKEEEKRIVNKQKKYSELECIKKIDLKNFGSGRQLRFVRYNDKQIFLFAQHQKRIMRDSFVRMSCLTCFDIDGNILWQKGTPNNDFEHTVVSCDLPFQIADVNGDKKLEVIYSTDFYVYIVDLITGKEISKMPTPVVKDDPLLPDYPFDRLNPDGLRVADFEGVGYKGCFILKDRYRNLFVYRAQDFKLLWRYYHNNTGHFPYVYDFDNDGKDELYVGYDFLDSKGNIKWSLPINSDHTDEILYLSYKEGEEKKFYLASGNEGFNIVNNNGKIIKSNNVGHAQRISAAQYDINKNELQIAVTSFWGADQLVYLFDGKGNLLKEREMLGNGNIISPVSYDGKHFLILSNANVKRGGLLDNDLDIVVKFPDDNHPDLCSEALDIDNDGITEILCWDQKSMYIYKAKKYSVGLDLKSYPTSGYSNYRGEYLIKKKS